MAEILKGVRILDLSQYIAGPYGTLLLGDLGAEIIKIENPEGGDLSRNLRQYTHKDESAYYLSFNRNKQSRTLTSGIPRPRRSFTNWRRSRTWFTTTSAAGCSRSSESTTKA